MGASTLTQGNKLGYVTSYTECAYANGYVYIFGGYGTDKISKIKVGVENENFDAAKWQELTTTMASVGMSSGEAVVAANGKIYIGGFDTPAGYYNKVFEFNPADETITEV
eukprot:230211_1